MPKRLLVLMILILFLLAACSGNGQTQVTDVPAPEKESEPTSEPTKVEPTKIEPTEEPSGASANQPATGPQMECTLVSDQPEAPAELVAIFGVTENDWVKGPDTAAVTFVEYSDFQ